MRWPRALGWSVAALVAVALWVAALELFRILFGPRG